ncbi:MAG: DUF1015 domain-containing protein [Ruminococcaceae bacterium]|nr:DUF1015 domain-containing protein [Oscillospiraceae bacterium]
MAVLKAFKAIRPVPEFADKVAALPYDVMTSAEAREIAKDNPFSFLHIDKAEIDLPEDTYIYDSKVYAKANENLNSLINQGVLCKDSKDCLYIYEQTRKGRIQTGIVGCTSIDDYMNNVIKKHELTRADKEADRINHVDTLDANTGPIFLAYRKNDRLKSIIDTFKSNHKPVYDFVSDEVRQRVWVIDENDTVGQIIAVFKDIPSLYIADGHHRAASAVKVGLKRRDAHKNYTGNEEFNFFLSVLFCAEDLAIMDYNRVIADLNSMTESETLQKISENFEVVKIGKTQYRPEKRHTFGMHLGGEWYKLSAKDGTYDDNDPVLSLDVSILQNNLISPVLGIDDPRTDRRIDFVGGIRGLDELEKRCRSDMKIAFAMYPTSLDELIAIADAGKIMPPKSTWFEPKLLSGLFIHKLS